MKKLSVPENISLHSELLPGMGKKEGLRFTVLELPGIIVLIVAWLICSGNPAGQLLALLLGMGYIIMVYALVVRIDGSASIYDYLTRIIRFQKEQKTYYYKHTKEVIFLVEDPNQVRYPAGTAGCGRDQRQDPLDKP